MKLDFTDVSCLVMERSWTLWRDRGEKPHERRGNNFEGRRVEGVEGMEGDGGGWDGGAGGKGEERRDRRLFFPEVFIV